MIRRWLENRWVRCVLAFALCFTLASLVLRQKQFKSTAHEYAREALRASEKRYRQLLESNIIGVMIVDWEGRILDANQAFLSMVGYTHQDLKEGLVGGENLTPPEYRVADEWAREK